MNKKTGKTRDRKKDKKKNGKKYIYSQKHIRIQQNIKKSK